MPAYGISGDSIKMDGHVFICYSRKDESFVLPLAKKLKNQGVPVWLDKWDIPSGSDWDLTIDNALNNCAHFLIILSPNSVKSKEVRSELRIALDENKHIVPVLYRACGIPRQLRLIQYIDLTSHSPDDMYALSEVSVALGIAEGSLPRPAEITTPKVEMPVSTITVANENIIESGSEVSNMQTLAEQVDVIASSKPDVYIQDRKYSSIQEAVEVGNPGETITLVAGTYQENLRIDKPFKIKGAGVEKTIIDGCRGGSVIIVGKNRANIDVTLEGITVKGGTGTEVKVADHDSNTHVCGGGIINYGKLIISDTIISDNEAYYGGGIFNRGTLNLEKGASVIRNAAYNGGGIYNQGGVRSPALINLNGCSIEKNLAKECGAGIYSVGNTVNLYSGTTISGNTAGNSGGGVYLAPSEYVLKMSGGDILDNHAAASGGGIYNYGGNVHLNGGNIFSNTARIGAGALNAGGKITLCGTRIHGNIADKDGDGLGGGISNSGDLILNSGSIDHNHASRNGGGICHKKKEELVGNLELVQDNTLGSDHIPDDIALC